MTDPQMAAAKRRLATLLADEHYGPALARLNRSQEREVLDLIWRGQSAEARKAIDRLDRSRRTRRTVRDRARRYANRPRWQRLEDRQDELDYLDDDPDLESQFWRAYDRNAG